MKDAGTLMRACLEAFLSADANQQGQRLRQLADASPGVFAIISCALMRDVKDTQNYRYLLALLNSRGQLIQVLQMLCATDPGAAGAATNLAMRLIPGFDRLLLRGQEPQARSQTARELDPGEFLNGVLETVDSSLQLLAAVEAELRVKDSRVRSRMSMLAGRVALLWEQFGDLQQDADPRVRANAVESLWGMASPMAQASFERALGDPNHRVRANALVGLYLQGDPRSLSGLLAMSKDPDSLVRAAAAWAMGRTGDARFEPQLQEMRRSADRNPMVIRNALLSISRLQRADATSPHEPLRVILLGDSSTMRSRSLQLHVESEDSGVSPALLATHVQLWDEATPVWNYRISRHLPEARPLSLLLPVHPDEAAAQRQGWAATVERMLAGRPEQEPWAVAHYVTVPAARNQLRTGAILHLSDDEGAELDSGPLSLPGFRMTPEEIAADAAAATDERYLPNGPLRLAAAQAAERQSHDLLLVVPALPAAMTSARMIEELKRVALEHDVRVHAVTGIDLAPKVSAAIRALCAATGGWHTTAEDDSGLHRGAISLAAALSGHWRIEIGDTQMIGHLRLLIRTGRYSGELASLQSATDRAA